MKKNVLLAIALVFMSVSTASAQSFLKKVGDAAKKVTEVTTPAAAAPAQAVAPAQVAQVDEAAPVAMLIESTRIIGDKLLISGKMQAPEDVRLMRFYPTIITPDGTTYECHTIWWGEDTTSPSMFDKDLVADINYAFDISFEIKSKKVTEIVAFTLEAHNHTAKKKFKIVVKNMVVPQPLDPNLTVPGQIEIYKNIYLRWTGAVEGNDSFQLNYVIDNKSGKDQRIQFIGHAMKITDNNGVGYTAEGTLKDNTDIMADIPMAGHILVNKPLKLNQIVLVEFASRYFNYRVKDIVIPVQ
ncbi:hypothetical protein LJB91_02215 [Bacteroidales bacterium OttesenSCG-928-L03]|nr:hypothetical protein [Bacteroidales bacterium OttesenSCG-928-L03]